MILTQRIWVAMLAGLLRNADTKNTVFIRFAIALPVMQLTLELVWKLSRIFLGIQTLEAL